MSEIKWKHHFENWQAALTILNDLGWNLTWKEHDQKWYLRSGESLLFMADTLPELESFVMGMAISLVVLPDSLLKEIREIANS